MATTTVTVGGNQYTLVAIPAKPAPSSVQVSYAATVGSVTSPYSMQTQTHGWVGADIWTGTVDLPPMYEADFEAWNSFLMELQGMTNAFQLRITYRTGALPGSATRKGKPVVVSGNAGANQLQTSGWTPSAPRLLLAGDMIQIGYRLHKVTETVTSDAEGLATLTVYPSLREAPVAGVPIIMSNPQGLFRLATNKFDYSVGVGGIVSGFRFAITEVR